MDFGSRLKEARNEAGMTQQQLADILGVAKSTVAGYESGNREPDFFKIKLIAQTLSVDADYLLGIRKNYFPTTKEEQEHLHKYRSIDNKGKHTVDTILEMEYIRCNKPHLVVNAAHAIEGANVEEQQHDEELLKQFFKEE